MTIQIESLIDDETKGVYYFTLFDITAVFTKYVVYFKPKGKRVWRICEFWDKYNERDSNLTEPDLPYFVKSEALEVVKNLIEIKTWKQFKNT